MRYVKLYDNGDNFLRPGVLVEMTGADSRFPSELVVREMRKRCLNMMDSGEEAKRREPGTSTYRQFHLFEEKGSSVQQLTDTPAGTWDRDAAERALDELFAHTILYRSSKAYHDLLKFISRFRWYSPFNAMLIHIQMPGAVFVAPAHRWVYEYRRRIKPGARPLVILQPMGPVMFVFDVPHTEGPPLPPEVENPFAVQGVKIGDKLKNTIENSKRDGVVVHTAKFGSQQAGSIGPASHPPRYVAFGDAWVPVRDEESRYASLVHELGHLYCGHLGTPNPRWWPDRRGVDAWSAEFEAESVAYLVCARAGINTRSERYLAPYLDTDQEIPWISLDCVMKAAGLIESMGKSALKPRGTTKNESSQP